MKLKMGEVYYVEFDDCCIRGEFSSKIVYLGKYDDVLKKYEEIKFENGVKLTTYNGCIFETIKEIFHEITLELEQLKINYNNPSQLIQEIEDLLAKCILTLKKNKDKEYLRKSLVIVYDAIRHTNSKDLSEEQVETIYKVIHEIIRIATTNGSFELKIRREFSKLLLQCNLRILPEPRKENHEDFV